jgi:NAD(P)-dependent dehydrogenase (short-subunit alcohol dehydrogenase family)
MAKRALVTGGNRGLGLEVCRQLGHRGYEIVLTSRAPTDVALALRAEGITIEHHSLDVADPRSAAKLAADLKAPIDTLVNNSGISMDGFDANVAEKTLATNFFGALHVTEALLPHVRDGGNIVMVSSGLGSISILAPHLRAELLAPDLTREALARRMQDFIDDVKAGRHAQNGWPSSAYGVSKVGINALARVYARELAPRRIRVNAVCPGWVRTAMGGRGAERDVREGAASIVWAAVLEDHTTGGFFRDGRAVPW